MNLIITSGCNRACPYCFAGAKVELGVSTGASNRHISLEDVDWYLSFLSQSDCKDFKILGGEPTLHPEFPEIIEQGLAGNFDITVFSNAIWPDSILAYFSKALPSRTHFLFNVNETASYSIAEQTRIKEVLSLVGLQGSLGFNIYRDDFDLLFLGDLIEEHGLKKEIRLGLASPIVGEKNEFIPAENLKQAGARLTRQLRLLETRDILGTFDCGFPLCMFSDEDLGHLVSVTKTGFQSICGSVIDVDMDLKAWPCFPLSNILNIDLKQFSTAKELDAYYQKHLAPLKPLGSTDDCATCKYLRRCQCTGGCLGRTLCSVEASGDTRLIERLKSPASTQE